MELIWAQVHMGRGTLIREKLVSNGPQSPIPQGCPSLHPPLPARQAAQAGPAPPPRRRQVRCVTPSRLRARLRPCAPPGPRRKSNLLNPETPSAAWSVRKVGAPGPQHPQVRASVSSGSLACPLERESLLLRDIWKLIQSF